MTAEKNINPPRERKIKTIARNRKARHDFEILETYEAGLELLGSEVKSLRAGKVNVSDSYATVYSGELILKNLHISPYEQATVNAHSPDRTRRLLLHKREIRKIIQSLEQKGLTVIPLHIYFSGPYVKIELGLARGRKKHDKRDVISKRESQREMDRASKPSR